MAFVKAERALGFDSRLVTLARNQFGFEEDICLDLPFMDGRLYRSIRPKFRSEKQLDVLRKKEDNALAGPKVWSPSGRGEASAIRIREYLWKKHINEFIESHDFYGFDLYQFDGGLGFSRRGKFASELHGRGKKIVCCYLGSDLRKRGVIRELDEISDCNFTVEFDHLDLHPHIQYLFFPFDATPYEPFGGSEGRVRVFHSATNRYYKGSDHIIETGRRLEEQLGIEFIFMENTPHAELIRTKQRCDIMIDQITNVGGIGYGVSSLEALAMGLVVCTRLTPEFDAFLPKHPFVNVTPENLYRSVADLVADARRRDRLRKQGIDWVTKYHDAKSVAGQMHDVYRERGWFKQQYADQ
ncbi:MAG: hypothetical protein HOH43_28160 [Candidatus Latescibacteria bacterium]|nr:hypothetical protein [Candidatus Latescibacterota bacterium]